MSETFPAMGSSTPERGVARRYLRARQVYPATGASPIQDGAVLLDGDRIAGVIPARELTDQDVCIAHYPEGTLLPGLIDAHCHLTLAGDGRTYEELAAESDAMMAITSIYNLQQHLASGVTTLRDNGGRNLVTFIVREACERGYVDSPQLLLAGRPITHTRGHFHWCNGVADGHDEIRRAVRQLVAEGADHIKLMATGGGTIGTLPYLTSYTVDELAAAVSTAHLLGTPTTAHARGKDGIVNAVEAGVDCIEHYEFLVHDESSAYAIATDGSRIDYDPRVTADVLERGIFVSFTMQAGYGRLLDLRESMTHRALSAAETRSRDSLELYFEAKLALFRQLLADGLGPQMVVSTDAGCGIAGFGLLHQGLELAVEGGMTPAEAIDSVTRIAALVVGMPDAIGTIETGKRADLVVVAGDPLSDIQAMRSVQAVYREGRAIRSIADGAPVRI